MFELMQVIVLSATLLSVTFLLTIEAAKTSKEEKKAKQFMKKLNKEFARQFKLSTEASWAYTSNITDYNEEVHVNVSLQIALENEKRWHDIKKFSNWQKYHSENLKRQFKLVQYRGSSLLSPEKQAKLLQTTSDMSRIFATARICDFKAPENCNLTIDNEINHILKTSDDPDELKHVWVEWRNAIGPKVRNLYGDYVELTNEVAKLNNFSDASADWLDDFETNTIEKDLEGLWTAVKPLYLQLHAYVRHKLRKKYGDIVSKDGPIPAHLLGNMWAQHWNTPIKFSLPYPKLPLTTITEELKKQKYTPLKMFETAEDFYTSLNLSAAPRSFWHNSIFKRPRDGRDLVCHASAWDFYDKDVRIKMCTVVNEEDFLTIHHEMGHVQFYLQYAHLPPVYRTAANPGFHEAIGDVIQLSVSTPKHLQKIGLMKKQSGNKEQLAINSLYKVALDKVSFLPFGYLVDKWRWEVFQGKIKPDQWNCRWWQMRQEYQGVEPPVDRSEQDFDPAAKNHVASDDQYIEYFAAFILQFQIHRSLCLEAGEYDPNDKNKPLHNCDIFNSTKAGNLFKKFLQLGNSKPWPYALKQLTGVPYMDASGILEYFKPLQTWLEKENKKNKAYIGWVDTKMQICPSDKKGEKEETEKKEDKKRKSGKKKDKKRKSEKKNVKQGKTEKKKNKQRKTEKKKDKQRKTEKKKDKQRKTEKKKNKQRKSDKKGSKH